MLYKNNIYTVTRKIFALYFLFFVFFLFLKTDSFSFYYDSLFQLLTLFVGYVYITYLKRMNMKVICLSLSVYLMVMMFVLQLFNVNFYGDLLGYSPSDADFYRTLGSLFCKRSYADLISYLYDSGFYIDDFGYPMIVLFSYKIFPLYPFLILIVLNTFVISLGVYYLYKLSALFLDINCSKYIAIIWGIMPFSICLGASNLKENFFVFGVILGFYCYYKYLFERKITYLFFSVLFCLFVFAFRLALGYAMILALLSVLLLSMNSNAIRRYYSFLLWISVLLIFLMFPKIVSWILEQRGYDYMTTVQNTSDKLFVKAGTLGILVNIMASIVGPFPNFVSNEFLKLTYITRYSLSVFYKLFISIFFVWMAYYVLKNKILVFSPMLIFISINILLISFTGYGMNLRYHWPHMPLFIILSVCGFEYFAKRRKSYLLYFLLSAFVVLFFNCR